MSSPGDDRKSIIGGATAIPATEEFDNVPDEDGYTEEIAPPVPGHKHSYEPPVPPPRHSRATIFRASAVDSEDGLTSEHGFTGEALKKHTPHEENAFKKYGANGHTEVISPSVPARKTAPPIPPRPSEAAIARAFAVASKCGLKSTLEATGGAQKERFLSEENASAKFDSDGHSEVVWRSVPAHKYNVEAPVPPPRRTRSAIVSSSAVYFNDGLKNEHECNGGSPKENTPDEKSVSEKMNADCYAGNISPPVPAHKVSIPIPPPRPTRAAVVRASAIESEDGLKPATTERMENKNAPDGEGASKKTDHWPYIDDDAASDDEDEKAPASGDYSTNEEYGPGEMYASQVYLLECEPVDGSGKAPAVSGENDKEDVSDECATIRAEEKATQKTAK
ncbi:hypothetical protein QR680_000306 [Steinernema hermaphroditum]|uniref:Uncharacterized protein n=1 Tax=Steinernema hermaphroditum TaxID=289476 RepID=A0AA39GU57_9BILA|nr:hypothetical protein QR680_000306 [Steinernema hermaphroditum]